MTILAAILAQAPSPTGATKALEQVKASTDWIDWVVAGVVVAVSLLAGMLLTRLIASTLIRRDIEALAARAFARSVGVVVILIGFVTALGFLQVQGLGAVLGALGIAGVAIAFALKDTIENLIAGLALQLTRPFRIGDSVSLGEFGGTIEDVKIRSVFLRTYDGERAQLPSAEVYRNAILNHTFEGTRRIRVEVRVAYDTDLDTLSEIALNALRALDLVIDDPAPALWVSNFADCAIEVVVLAWFDTTVTGPLEVTDAVLRALKRAFEANGIRIAPS